MTPVGAARVLMLAFAALLAAVLMMGPLTANAQGAPKSFADLAENLLPAVVNISTTQVVEDRASTPDIPQFPPGSPFEDFFKDFLEKNGNSQNPKKRKATSLGSGFIIQSIANGDTFVVTNNHVVEGADEVSVILQDDTRLAAEIVGRDVKSDLAVLKVRSKVKLASVNFGDSRTSRVGDWVVAIGNPFGLGGTVTAGIISARGRDINAGPYDDFIQTDASINRGNSGGPMFNLKGEVIGINTAIFSPTGGSVGIGFAIPASTAKAVIDQLMKTGEVSRGWLGVHIQVVTASIAETLGLKKAEGALVASVIEDGPAAKAGLKARDVILEFDGKRVSEMRKLPRIVAATEIEKAVKVKVWRDGRMQTLDVMIGRLDNEAVAASTQGQGQPKPKTTMFDLDDLGLTVAKLQGDLLDRFKLDKGSEGLVITAVDDASSAFEEGIRPGDLLIEVNQQKVTSPKGAKRLVKAAQKDGKRSVLLLIKSSSGFRFVAVKLK